MTHADVTFVAAIAVVTVVLGVAALWWWLVESPSRRRDAATGRHAAVSASPEAEADETTSDDYGWREGWLEGEITATLAAPDVAESGPHDYERWDHCDRCYAVFEQVGTGVSVELAQFYLDQDAWLEFWRSEGKLLDHQLDMGELADPFWTHRPEVAV